MNQGMDELLEMLKEWEDAGGVGSIQFKGLEVAGIQFQHPLIRQVAKVFSKVSTMDGTHNTTKFEKSTLITSVGQDSFGHMFHAGCAYSASESLSSMSDLVKILGLEEVIETLITDASKASFALALQLACGHILCSYHFRKHLSKAMDNVGGIERKSIWDSIMKTLKWQGYKSDAALMVVSVNYLFHYFIHIFTMFQDINLISAKFKGSNSKLDLVIDTLIENRKNLCAFHTTQLFSFGKSSSQLSECQNSQIKGGNSYARWLRAQNYLETLVHIATLMRLYIDETKERIQKCVLEKRVVSPWIEDKLRSSLRKINRCLFPQPMLQGTEGGDEGVQIWLVFEAVPVKGYLPAFQQRHLIRFKVGVPAPCTCSCPYFTSTRLPCDAMCAIFATKNIQSIEAISHHMDGMWLIRSHPIYPIAMALVASAGVVLPEAVAVSHATPAKKHVAIERANADALRSIQLPTDVSSRRHVLSTLFEQVLSRTAACASSSSDLHAFLVQHRSKLSQSQTLFVPPPLAISVRQTSAGLGPSAEVPNRANAPKRGYNPSAKKRVSTAKLTDPTKYSTHKNAGFNQPVQCLCGCTYNNEKKVRHNIMHYLTCVHFLYRQHGLIANPKIIVCG